MYYINILKLITKYLKNITPEDKDILETIIKFSESKQNIKNIVAFNQNIATINNNYANQINKIISIFNPYLDISLILEEWKNGIDYKVIQNNKLEELINYCQLDIDFNLELSTQNYEILQQTLIDLVKDIIRFISKKECLKFSKYFIEKIIV